MKIDLTICPRAVRALAKRSEGHNAGAAVVDHPLRMFRQELVIDAQVFTKRSGDRGDDARPVHGKRILTISIRRKLGKWN